jgi:hypothetical protein
MSATSLLTNIDIISFSYLVDGQGRIAQKVSGPAHLHMEDEFMGERSEKGTGRSILSFAFYCKHPIDSRILGVYSRRKMR